uniref:Uncharacterized protein n=1 Tax=Anopheles epiroticus TaxID=199890 RepID=A0A182P857_9DIPT
MAISSLSHNRIVGFLLVSVVPILWIGCVARVMAPDEKCEWRYRCCVQDDVNGSCKTLCPIPTIVCSPENMNKSDLQSPNKAKIQPPLNNVAEQCNEGYRRDTSVLPISWIGCVAFVMEPDEKCEWQYRCCVRDEVNGSCKTLCTTPTIVCPEEETSTSDPTRKQSPKVVLTAPCNEGYRRDHTARCRKIFEEPVYV